MLLFHCPGVAKLPANAERKLIKCCVSLSCPITMLLSYLFAQFPVGHWLEDLQSELSSLLGWGWGSGCLPSPCGTQKLRNLHSQLPPPGPKTSHRCSFLAWMETFSQTVIIFHSCYCEMTTLLPPLSFQKTVLLS